MSRHTDAATEMCHNNIHILVHFAAGLGITASSSLGIEGVEYRLALHERQSGIACACHHLVHNNGIGHKGWASTLACNIVGNERAEVAHVLMMGMVQIVLHLLVNSIHAAVQGLKQTATTYYGIKLQRYACLAQEIQHKVLAVFVLVVYGHKLVYLFLWVQTV